ncbi:hypothetical protein ACIQB5_04280 [Streptomyces sp. NPDC088560]
MTAHPNPTDHQGPTDHTDLPRPARTDIAPLPRQLPAETKARP